MGTPTPFFSRTLALSSAAATSTTVRTRATTEAKTATATTSFELDPTLHPLSSLTATTTIPSAAAVSTTAMLDVYNPATGMLVGQVPDMDVAHAHSAIEAASDALHVWSLRTARERSAILREWHGLVLSHEPYLSSLITAEMGKPLAEAKGEVAYSASFISWFAEQGLRANGDTLPILANNQRMMVLKQPVGVCAAITPWNFPLAMLARKAAPALAAGCTMVVKPAEDTPLSAEAFVTLAVRAGVPREALPLVTCSRRKAPEVGAALCTSPNVAKISFTGSTAVGKVLAKNAAASTVKRVSLELGGNAPFVVFKDADLDAAVAGLMASKFRASGQTCVCTNRVLVDSSVHDNFVDKLCLAMDEQLVVGNGAHEGVTQGPLIHTQAAQRVADLVQDALAKGAIAVRGGEPHPTLGAGFYQPTLLTHVTSDMRVCQEEIFGPVAPVMSFETEAEALELANDTRAGLVAYAYTQDLGRAWRTAERFESGMVGINTGIVSTEVAPFGGIKESGIGREGSPYGLDEYLEMKYVCLDLGPDK